MKTHDPSSLHRSYHARARSFSPRAVVLRHSAAHIATTWSSRARDRPRLAQHLRGGGARLSRHPDPAEHSGDLVEALVVAQPLDAAPRPPFGDLLDHAEVRVRVDRDLREMR